jgi:hypothetical protein
MKYEVAVSLLIWKKISNKKEIKIFKWKNGVDVNQTVLNEPQSHSKNYSFSSPGVNMVPKPPRVPQHLLSQQEVVVVENAVEILPQGGEERRKSENLSNSQFFNNISFSKSTGILAQG